MKSSLFNLAEIDGCAREYLGSLDVEQLQVGEDQNTEYEDTDKQGRKD